MQICDHIIFNSFAQFEKHKAACAQDGVSVGIRVNPECSTQEGEHAIYDPCAYGSRLGVTLENFPEDLPPEIEGLHFHTPVSYTHLDVYKRQALHNTAPMRHAVAV